ncbi:TIGR03545 family protein [Idiomarina xiamenensis]|uniref:TIGR03545 family protein n=1 Tax=Idiomarina xiamenensis 10-D-4 TaxID=740709 RepID=K2KYE0_9GAMM|nr:TIGR03545 family protein [Idiomarina xiamenensis]EKE87579.1 hypothetical protein A10D4_00755 [Idiomarina xiamenensis 10-D-4]
MKRSIIRWPGLLAFVVFVGLLVAFSWLFLDSILRWGMEKTLGRLNGAEVNIERVEHSWVPLSIGVYGIQVTNPQQPENNRVVVGEVRADIDTGQLLLGRYIFEQMNASGIRVDQPRDSAGEVYAPVTKDSLLDAAGSGLEALDIELPSVDDIMQQVNIQTETVIANAKQTFAEQQQKLEQAKAALPSDETLKSYEQRIKELTEGKIEGLGDLAQRREQLEKLKADFRADRDAVKQFKDTVSQARETLSAELAAVKSAPGDDIDRIQQFFKLDSQGLGNVTSLVFGEKARQWSQYILLAYEQVAPMLARSSNDQTIEPARGQGQWLSFTEDDAPPEFLIKKAVTEFAFGDTVLDVDWRNITHQHQQLGQPTTFQARADNNGLWQSFNLNGELSLGENGIDARQQWQLKGLKLSDTPLSESSAFSATLLATTLDTDGSMAVRSNQLEGNGAIRLANLDIQASGEQRWAQLVGQALGQLQRLDIRANMSGDITSPSLSLNSDLDRQLTEALTGTAMSAAQDKLDAVKARLNEQVQSALSEQQPQLAELTQLLELADSKDSRLNDLLNAKAEDSVGDKLKEGLFKKLGGNN